MCYNSIVTIIIAHNIVINNKCYKEKEIEI